MYINTIKSNIIFTKKKPTKKTPEIYIKKAAIWGTFFILILSVFLKLYYNLSEDTVAILVSAVNNSLWENIKIFLVSFIIWGFIETICFKPSFKQFVVSKIITVYSFGIIAIIFFEIVFLFSDDVNTIFTIISAVVFVSVAQFSALYLYNSELKLTVYFVPAIFLLVLLIVIICCFSVFPPKISLFEDTEYNTYGIIKSHLDAGAYYLNNVYFC